MLKSERETEIINILKKSNGFVTVNTLCKTLYASQSSIRRDLTNLENKGIIKRSYGGAELITNFSNITSFNWRSHYNIDEKKIIAKKAAPLVKDGDIVFLDQSSTTFYLAAELLSKTSITIVTNSIEIINLISNTNIKLIASGGYLSHENRVCFLGNDAQKTFENIYADIMFFSAKSLVDDGTIWDCCYEETLIRLPMLKNSAKRVFLCDSEKIGTHSPYRQCNLKDIDYLVCENDFALKFSDFSETLKIL